MTAAERAIKRIEENLHDLSERHREAMLRHRFHEATLTAREILGVFNAVVILREEMQKERKQ